jgi:hypothetical protein
MVRTTAVLLMLIIFSYGVCGAQEPDCNIQEGPCVKDSGGVRVAFDVLPKPVRSMRELTFRVKAEGLRERPETLLLDLSMPGMDMGPNRVELRMARDGSYEGKGVIVKCASGRKLWKARVLDGGENIAEYTFNVEH